MLSIGNLQGMSEITGKSHWKGEKADGREKGMLRATKVYRKGGRRLDTIARCHRSACELEELAGKPASEMSNRWTEFGGF